MDNIEFVYPKDKPWIKVIAWSGSKEDDTYEECVIATLVKYGNGWEFEPVSILIYSTDELQVIIDKMRELNNDEQS